MNRVTTSPNDPAAGVIATPAVMSTTLASAVRGAPREAVVIASFPRAAYVDVGDDLMVIVTSDGIHHPNAVILNLPSTARPLAGLPIGTTGRVGDGHVRVGDLDLHAARWWDPRPRLRGSSPHALRVAAGITRTRVHGRTGHGSELSSGSLVALVAALSDRDGPAALVAADRMLGLGPGLTPAGDDMLAGSIAGILVLAPALAAHVPDAHHDGLVPLVEELGACVAARAIGRTTSVSAALLRHAARARLAAPVTGLVRAWTTAPTARPARPAPTVRPAPTDGPAPTVRTLRVGSPFAEAKDPTRNASRGHGDAIVGATDRLLAVGSSSGRDLALGLLAAVDLLTATESGRPTSSPIPAERTN